MHSLVWHMSRVGRPLLSCIYTGKITSSENRAKRNRLSKCASATENAILGAFACTSSFLTSQSATLSNYFRPVLRRFQQFGQNQIEIQVAEQKYNSIIWYDIQWSSLAWLVEFCNQSNYLLYESRGELQTKIFWKAAQFWMLIFSTRKG